MGTINCDSALILCPTCNQNITRKAIYCQSCSNPYHSYCVDSPLRKDNWSCSNCVASAISSESMTNETHVDEGQSSLVSLIDDVKKLKESQNILMTSFAVLNALKEGFEKYTAELDVFQEKLNSIANIERYVEDLSDRTKNLESENNFLKNENVLIRNELRILHSRCNLLENHAYHENAEIRGVPMQKNENLAVFFKKWRTRLILFIVIMM